MEVVCSGKKCVDEAEIIDKDSHLVEHITDSPYI
jgi:hypothetical protein